MHRHDSRAALLLIRLDFRLEIPCLIRLADLLLASLSDDDPGCVGEEVVHFLERLAGSLGQQEPEEDGVGEVADDEEVVELVADVGQGDGRDLPDHGVEGEGGHGRDADTLGACAGVEDLGGDDPGEGAAGGAKREVVEPGHDDKAPFGAVVGRDTGREFGEEDGGDDEGDHVAKVAENKWTATAEFVDKEHAQQLGDQGDNAVDGLVFQGVVAADALH